MSADMEKGAAAPPPHSRTAPPRAQRREATWRHVLLLTLLVPLSWVGVRHLRTELLPSLLDGEYGSGSGDSASLASLRRRALKILKHHPLIDGHNDLAIAIAGRHGDQIYNENFTKPFEQGGMPGEVDLPRIDAGEYGGAFWSAFWLCPANPFDFSTEAYDPIVRATLHQIDLLRRLSAVYPHYFPPATATSAEALAAFRKHGTHIGPLAIEGLHQVGNSYANLRLYYDLGVRYATLNWNCHNIYTDAAAITFLANATTIPSTPYHGGVSAKGREMIGEMNRLGMIVDLAHVSADTMRDVLVGQHNDEVPIEGDGGWEGSLAPPIFSHSSARAICPHPRNVPDDVLELVRRRGSVVMVNFNPDFISCHYPEGADPSAGLPVTDAEGATLEKVADHIMHIGGRIGFEHVGLGSDFDGIESTPRGLEGVDKMPDLVAELLRRGVKEKQVIGIVGGNVLRVWGEVERVSKRLQKGGMLPAEDELKAPSPSMRR